MATPIRRDGDFVSSRALTIAIDAPWHAEGASVAIDLHLPRGEPRALLFCVPGGGVNRGYYDLEGGFSFARAMTAAGYAVAAIDPPGVGDSTRPADGFLLNADVLADSLHAALDGLLRQEPGLAALPRMAVGHSAGALLLAVTQDRHRDFAAMALLCFGVAGLPHMLNDEERAAAAEPDGGRARFPELARRRFGGQAYIAAPSRADDTPAARALRAVHDQVIAVIGSHSMTPGNVAAELGRIDVPVLLAAGDRDITGPPHLLPSSYAACRDLSLFVVADAGHHIFVADEAPHFFRRTRQWLARITEDLQ